MNGADRAYSEWNFVFFNKFDLGFAESEGLDWGFVRSVGFDLLPIYCINISLALVLFVDFRFRVSVEREGELILEGEGSEKLKVPTI